MPLAFRRLGSAHSWSVGFERFSKYATLVATLLFLVYIVGECPACGGQVACYDVMGATGFLTFALTAYLSLGIRRRFRDLMQELADNAALDGRSAFEAAVTRSVLRWCVFFMIVATLVVVAGFVSAGAARKQQVLFAAGVIAALVAGERYGRLACYSRGTGLIFKAGGTLKIDFWHPDNAGGLLPLSNFYLYSMFIAAIPAIWLGSWFFAIPNTTEAFGHRYDVWRLPYAVMWVVVVLLALFIFIRPIFTIHQAMAREKDEFLKPFGRIAHRLQTFHDEFGNADLEDTGPLVRVEALRRIYRDAYNVSVWPFDAKVIGIFTSLNIAQLLIPLLLALVGGHLPDFSAAIKDFAAKFGGS